MAQQNATSTAGKPFDVTNRLVLAIAVPMTLAYVTTPLLGFVDTAVVGQLGDAALLGGLAAGAVIFDLVFATFNFLRSGTTGLVAQALGRGDAAEERAVFWRALILALCAGGILLLLSPLILWLGTTFMAADAPTTAAMQTYFAIRILCAPLALVNYAVLGYFLGRGEASMGLALQLLLNGVNIVLSILFGLHLGWGLAGVAWGTVCGEAAAALAGLSVVLRRFHAQPRLALARILDPAALRLMLSLNTDILIRSFALMAAYAMFARQGAQLGTAILAANAVLMHFFMVASYFLDGFATAAEQLAGRAIGAHQRLPFSRAVKLTALWGFATAAIGTIIILLFGAELIGIVTTADEVRALALRYLPWAAFAAISGVLAFQMDGVFIGATWSRDMRNAMVLSLIAFAALTLALGSLLGNDGLWAALHCFLLIRGLTLLAIMPRRSTRVFQA